MQKITRENQPYTRWAKRDDRFLIEGVIQIIITSIILLAKKKNGFHFGFISPYLWGVPVHSISLVLFLGAHLVGQLGQGLKIQEDNKLTQKMYISLHLVDFYGKCR